MEKIYDKAYFDHWYRQHGGNRPAVLRRKVALAVAMAEYHLGRPLRTVLDIGCGEGAWRAPLLKQCPTVRYLGFDSSTYAIERYGARRQLHYANFADFSQLRPCPPVDLLICADVLHYLSPREIDLGLPGLAALCGGVAFLECFTREDAVEGDEAGFYRRPASFYRKRLSAQGFVQIGSHCWLAPALAGHSTALETCAEPSTP